MTVRMPSVLASFLAALVVLATAHIARADDCCRYVIEGCGKKQQVCVAGDCNSDHRAQARSAFEKKNSCSSSNDASSLHTCENERCDIDLRKK
jgi:hypothetical protein